MGDWKNVLDWALSFTKNEGFIIFCTLSVCVCADAEKEISNLTKMAKTVFRIQVLFVCKFTHLFKIQIF